jgi:hypothetical protein
METQHSLTEFPFCPNCVKPMVLAPAGQCPDGPLEINTFECRRCSIIFTEVVTGAGAAPERVSALHGEAFHALH